MTSERTEIKAESAPPRPEKPELTTKQLTGIIGALALAAFLMILNETVLTVALPGIMSDMNISAAAGQWLTTGFLLTMSVVIPTTGFLLQRFSTRSLFIFALSSFFIGTLLAIFAPSFAVLLAARIIQAIGTAIVLPLLMTTTLTLIPMHKRGAVMGLNSIVISVGPAVGPTVSGAIVHAWGWHYIFVLMAPLSVIILALGIIFLKLPSNTRKLPVDVISVILSALAFGLLVYGISTIDKASENMLLTVATFAIGLVSLALFIRRQIRLTREGKELLNLTPFTSRTFTFAILMIMIAFGTLLGSIMMVPIILESGKGINSLAIGMMLLPGGLAQAIVSPIFGRIYDRHGPRPVLIPGAIMLALGQWMYVSVTTETELWMFMLSHIVFSIGLALLMTGLMSSAMASVNPRLYGHGSAIFNTGQQLGGAIGTTIFITVLTALSNAKLQEGAELAEALFAGAHAAFIVGALLGTAGVVLSFFVKVEKRG
ncbi:MULTISPECIES: MDR family MFS transporter [unclassified Arthrobacter]|uniref:MDR family MFS transporter n=1 Tax=unclassified Arthrobacter TaxID=235627 RepID=UPI00215713E5|nr:MULTISPECIES: MDR family MFS transporter [unclassified Arthrobacter]